MRGKKHRRAHVIKNPDEKINPHVIRQLFFEIIDAEFEGDRGLAAHQLRLQNPILGNDKPFTKDIISNIIDDRTALKYAHLEAIANYYNLPTFMLLLFTRLRSEIEKSPLSEIHEVSEIQLLMSFFSDLEMTIGNCDFTPRDLARWRDKYNEVRLI